MFERHALVDLESWARSPTRKPLVVRGARQVGKTSLIDLFSRSFDRYVRLDLEGDAQASLFRRGLEIDDLVQAIRLRARLPPGGERVLFFFDEVQACPEAIASLKSFCERRPDLFVIAAGSLLEAVLQTGQASFPVGRVEYLFMHPLTFHEFLVATGDAELAACHATVPLSAAAVPELQDRFHRYAQVGGMPAIVERYALDRDVSALGPFYQTLVTGYLDDIPKYARNAAQDGVLRFCLEVAPFEAGRRIKFARFGRSSYGSREVGEALKTLGRAGLLRLVHPTTQVAPPATPEFRKWPRLQYLDTGLLSFVVGLQGQFYEHRDLHDVHRGIIAQHVVGQELDALSSRVLRLPTFWVREKAGAEAEVDFVLPYRGGLVAVEVKAGPTGTLRSLHQFIDANTAAPPAVAVRLRAGPLAVVETRTPAGTPFRLLDLPYSLAARVEEHLDWLLAR